MAIDLRYVRYLLFAACASTVSGVYFWYRTGYVDLPHYAVAFALGAALTSIVTIRLPVFSAFYRARTEEAIRKYRGFANDRVSALACGLISGVVIGFGMYSLGMTDRFEPGLIAAVTAMVISQYHKTVF